MRQISLAFIFLFSLATAAVGAENANAISTLRSLAAEFKNARELPLGSRPRPPSVNINKLVGLSSSSIQKALGVPDPQEEDLPPLDCQATQCWSFAYGPGAAPIPDPIKNPDGTTSIYVQTGGPWLLICGFENENWSKHSGKGKNSV